MSEPKTAPTWEALPRLERTSISAAAFDNNGRYYIPPRETEQIHRRASVVSAATCDREKHYNWSKLDFAGISVFTITLIAMVTSISVAASKASHNPDGNLVQNTEYWCKQGGHVGSGWRVLLGFEVTFFILDGLVLLRLMKKDDFVATFSSDCSGLLAALCLLGVHRTMCP